MAEGFAHTPEPPYYAVIFSSQRTPGDHGYAAMAEETSAASVELLRSAEELSDKVARFRRQQAGEAATPAAILRAA